MKKIVTILSILIVSNLSGQGIIKNFPNYPQHNAPQNVWDTTATKANLASRIYGLYPGAMTFVEDIDSFYVYNDGSWRNLQNYIATGETASIGIDTADINFVGELKIKPRLILPYDTSHTAREFFDIDPERGTGDLDGDSSLIFTEGGNLGIGTVTPTSKLTILQSQDNDAITINGFDDKAASYGKMYLDASGYFSVDVNGRYQLRTNGTTILRAYDQYIQTINNKYLSWGNANNFMSRYASADGKWHFSDGALNDIITITDTGSFDLTGDYYRNGKLFKTGRWDSIPNSSAVEHGNVTLLDSSGIRMYGAAAGNVYMCSAGAFGHGDALTAGGFGNVAMTVGGLGSSMTGSDNVFIGESVATYKTTGNSNIFIGSYAGEGQAETSSNIYMGYRSGKDNDQDFNVGIGHINSYQAHGEKNVYLGDYSGYETDGNNNTAVGYESLEQNIGDAAVNNNVAIGPQAGRRANGSGNIFLGYQAGHNAGYGINNMLYFDNNDDLVTTFIKGDMANDLLTLNSDVTIAGGGSTNQALTLKGKLKGDYPTWTVPLSLVSDLSSGSLDSLDISGAVLRGDSLWFYDGSNYFGTLILSYTYNFPPPTAPNHIIKVSPAIPSLAYNIIYKTRPYFLDVNSDLYASKIRTYEPLEFGEGSQEILRQGNTPVMKVIGSYLDVGPNQFLKAGEGFTNYDVVVGTALGYGLGRTGGRNVLLGNDMFAGPSTTTTTIQMDTNTLVGQHLFQTMPTGDITVRSNVVVGNESIDNVSLFKNNVWFGSELYFDPSGPIRQFNSTFMVGSNPDDQVAFIDSTNALMWGHFSPGNLNNQTLTINGNLDVDNVASVTTTNLTFGGVVTADSVLDVREIFKLQLQDTSQVVYKIPNSVVVNSADTLLYIYLAKWKKL